MSTNTPEIEERRWQMVCGRDRTLPSSFIYAVRSTGVFCRPGCPSRLPRRANTVFFETPAQAVQAGFRPCRRCHPDSSVPDPVTSRVHAIADYIRLHAEQTLTLAHLGREANMSPHHLQRSFTTVMGVSPRAFQASSRLRSFKTGLRGGQDVLSAAFDAGYGSASRAYAQIGQGLAMSPTVYRRGGRAETIGYATRPTTLGMLMMAATARGVCFVQFGDTEEDLLVELAREFPAASLHPSGPAATAPLDDWMAALQAHLATGGPHPDIPLDLRGTALQLRAWQFLTSLQRGQTLSYGAFAASLGMKRGARAAAGACAANRVAVLVPCHRVLRADGGLGGYRWGLDRKRALLANEQTNPA